MPVGKITKSSVEAIKPCSRRSIPCGSRAEGFGVNCTPRPPVLPCPIQLHGRRGRIGWSTQPAPIAAYAALALAARAQDGG
jgi:hypothetical protein